MTRFHQWLDIMGFLAIVTGVEISILLLCLIALIASSLGRK